MAATRGGGAEEEEEDAAGEGMAAIGHKGKEEESGFEEEAAGGHEVRNAVAAATNYIMNFCVNTDKRSKIKMKTKLTHVNITIVFKTELNRESIKV